jgi:hypothetical protein
MTAAELRATAGDLDRIVLAIDQLVTDLTDCAAQLSVPPDVRRCTSDRERGRVPGQCAPDGGHGRSDATPPPTPGAASDRLPVARGTRPVSAAAHRPWAAR